MDQRKIRVLLGKGTMDAHDRGVRYLATKLREAGMEVIFMNFLEPEQIAAAAVQEDVDVVGISILSGMKPTGDGSWKGNIYNPEDGKTYSASMMLQGASLKVQGCALAIICKTQMWSR